MGKMQIWSLAGQWTQRSYWSYSESVTIYLPVLCCPMQWITFVKAILRILLRFSGSNTFDTVSN